jgi:hypothetical protein
MRYMLGGIPLNKSLNVLDPNWHLSWLLWLLADAFGLRPS